MNVLRTKSIEQSIADTDEPEHRLRKRLGPLELIVFGVGVIIGTGIFVLTGKAAGVQAGRPAYRRGRRSRCRSCSPGSPALWPGCATPNSPAPCRSPGRRTRSRTPASAS